MTRMAAPTGTRTRKSAEERRAEIVAAAIERFAAEGYVAASTEAIARDAGISQPYLFRLFRTKKELFLACHDRCMERITETFREAAHGTPPEGRLAAMGHAYMALLADRRLLLFQMQSYAASADPGIQAHVRRHYGELVKEVTRLSGAGPPEVWMFFAHGMLLNVVASLDLESVAGDDAWAAAWSDPGPLIEAATPPPEARPAKRS
jgi:AcrR family transcriptional regulator